MYNRALHYHRLELSLIFRYILTQDQINSMAIELAGNTVKFLTIANGVLKNLKMTPPPRNPNAWYDVIPIKPTRCTIPIDGKDPYHVYGIIKFISNPLAEYFWLAENDKQLAIPFTIPLIETHIHCSTTRFVSRIISIKSPLA